MNKTPKVDRAFRRAMLKVAPKAHYSQHRPRDCSIHLSVAVLLSIFCSTITAQNVDRISKREIERRQTALPQGVAALARAQAAMQARNYAVAHDEFRNALNSLPDAVTSAKAHDEAVAGFCESGVKVAEQNIADGEFVEAESVVREVLEDRYDPNCRP